MITVAIIITSDTRSRGIKRDETVPILSKFFTSQGWELVDACVVPDEYEKIKDKMIYYSDQLGIDLILTSGGTGFSKRDITPEATQAVIEKETPGFSEIIRLESFKLTKKAILSRAVAGIRGNTLIINLPGNPQGAIDSLNIIKEAIPHGIDIIKGKGEPHTKKE